MTTTISDNYGQVSFKPCAPSQQQPPPFTVKLISIITSFHTNLLLLPTFPWWKQWDDMEWTKNDSIAHWIIYAQGNGDNYYFHLFRTLDGVVIIKAVIVIDSVVVVIWMIVALIENVGDSGINWECKGNLCLKIA